MSFNDSDILFTDSREADQDRNLVVKFSMESRIDSAASESENRPIYREKEFITILIPGDKRLTVHRPVMPADRARFPLQWQAFKNSQKEVVIGTPLEVWPNLSQNQRKELEYFNIRTVEQLATIQDGMASNMMGIMSLKQQAQRYLTATKEKAGAAQLAAELEKKDAQIDGLKSALEELAKKVEALAAPQVAAPAPAPKKGEKY